VYLRRCYRHKDGKRRAYWALVESYRTARETRQRVVAYLGKLEERRPLGVRRGPAGCAPQEDLIDWKASPKWVEVDLRGLPIQTVAVLVVGIC
jgi:hypothetical protein